MPALHAPPPGESDRLRAALALTEQGIIADEGPFHVNRRYLPDPHVLGRARGALAATLTAAARELRAWARRGLVSPDRALIVPRAPQTTHDVPRCAYCTRVIADREPDVLLAGARLHNSETHPCYGRYAADWERWESERCAAGAGRRPRPPRTRPAERARPGSAPLGVSR